MYYSYEKLSERAKEALTSEEYYDTIRRAENVLETRSDHANDSLEFAHVEDNIFAWANSKADKIIAIKSSKLYDPNEPFKIIVDSTYTRIIDKDEIYRRINGSVYYLCSDYSVARSVLFNFENYYCPTISKDFAEHLSQSLKENGIEKPLPHIDEKTSKYFRKLATALGFKFVKADEYMIYSGQISERDFAYYADAINPTQLERKTVLSVDPVDYLLMSNGTGWSSCYCINASWKGEDYRGCYSSGTWSYMNDSVSMIMYVVSDRIISNYPYADKIIREVVMFDDYDTICHSRAYPQGDEEEKAELYKELRAVAQRMIADLYELPNMWSVKANDNDGYVTSSDFVGYDDLHAFRKSIKTSANTSDAAKYPQKMHYAGATAYCPVCGETLGSERYLCGACDNNEIYCSCCGAAIDRDVAREIDGEYYCEDCCFYCERHGEWEAGDFVYVDNLGNICEGAFEEGKEDGDIFFCNYHDCWEYDPDHATVYDENEDEVETVCDRGLGYGDYYYCEECGRWFTGDVLVEDDCCEFCRKEREEEENA